MEWWMVAGTSGAIISVAYAAIGISVIRGLLASGQLRSNRLALATACIFLSCGIGHFAHLVHVLNAAASGTAALNGLRFQYDSHVLVADTITAGIAIWYWSLRSQYSRLLARPLLFDDLDERSRQALAFNDVVIQQLATARLALELDRPEVASAAVERALEHSTSLVADLQKGGVSRRGA